MRARYSCILLLTGVSFAPARRSGACVAAFRPKIVYPYHYRGQNTQEFADALKNTPGVEVRLRKLEGEP